MVYGSRFYAFAHINDPRYAREVIEFLTPDPREKILEIGCGRGYTLKKLQETVPNTYGVDISSEAVANGIARNMTVMDAEALEFEKESFDSVCSFHTIEHLHRPEKFLEGIQKLLKPEGKALIVYPAEPVRGLFSLGAACAIFKNPFRTREIHVQKFTPKRMQTMAEELGFIHITSKFFLLNSPHYSTIIQKDRL